MLNTPITKQKLIPPQAQAVIDAWTSVGVKLRLAYSEFSGSMLIAIDMAERLRLVQFCKKFPLQSAPNESDIVEALSDRVVQRKLRSGRHDSAWRIVYSCIAVATHNVRRRLSNSEHPNGTLGRIGVDVEYVELGFRDGQPLRQALRLESSYETATDQKILGEATPRYDGYIFLNVDREAPALHYQIEEQKRRVFVPIRPGALVLLESSRWHIVHVPHEGVQAFLHFKVCEYPDDSLPKLAVAQRFRRPTL